MIDLTPDHAKKVIATLTKLGLVPQLPVNPADFASSQIRQAWNEDKGMQVFSMIDRANPLRIVALFVKHPIPFEDLWARSKVIHVESTSIRIASLSDLIHLKRLAGAHWILLILKRWNRFNTYRRATIDE